MNDLVCNQGFCATDSTFISSPFSTKPANTSLTSKTAPTTLLTVNAFDSLTDSTTFITPVTSGITSKQSSANMFTSAVSNTRFNLANTSTLVQQSNNPSISSSQISTLTYKQSMSSLSVSNMFTSQVTFNKVFGSCSNNGDCAGPLKCIGNSGSQYCSCNLNDDCPGSGQICTNNLCTCVATTNCPTGQICQTYNGYGICTCTLDAQCSKKCVIFSNSLFGICDGLKGSLPPIPIASGRKANGQSCTEDNDCISNKCSDRLCVSG